MAKGRRKKGMRRAYLKTYSQAYINTGKGPNTEVLAEYSERAKGLRYDIADKLFGLSVMSKPNQPRQEVIDKVLSMLGVPKEATLEELRSNKHILPNVTLRATRFVNIKMFHNSRCDEYFFIEEDKLNERVRRSIVYGSRARALEKFPKKITWVEEISLAEGPP